MSHSRRHGPARWAALAAASMALCLLWAAPAVAATAGPDRIVVQSVDTAAWPKVTVRAVLPSTLLAGGALRPGDFVVSENGARISDVKVAVVPDARRTLDVLLVIDVSGSMRGAPLEQAKAAALQFLSGLGPNDRVGIVAFEGKASVVASLTTDRARLADAIAGLAVGNQTALYDAMSTALGVFGAPTKADRAMIVLSDGSDTTSGHTVSALASELAGERVPVYAVSLGISAKGAAALQTLANASGGRVIPVADAADLGGTFSSIAQQLTTPYDITYTSLRPPTKETEIGITASSGTGRASVVFALPNPDATAGSRPLGTPAALPSGIWPGVIALLVFVAMSLVVLVVLLLTRPEPNALGQLRYFEQMRARAGRDGVHSTGPDADSVAGRVVELAGVVASRGGFDTAIRTALERAGLPLRPVEYMVLHSSLVLVLGGLVQLAGHSLVLTVLAVVILALAPVVLLRTLARRRTEAFQEQLPDVLNLLAGSLRAGWGLQQAVGVVVNEMGAPAGPEFARVVTEARLGIALEDSLEKMAIRMDSEDFRSAVTAIAIQREVGGNLAEVLDMVASTIRERSMLRRQVSALTAEGRLSAIILIALPFFEGIVLYTLNPRYFAPLVSSPGGLGLLLIGAVLLAVGIVWLRNVVKIEV